MTNLQSINKKYLSPPVSCLTCTKQYSAKGIFTHFICAHGTDEQKATMKNARLLGLKNGAVAHIKKQQIKKTADKKLYSVDPRCCEYCKVILEYDKRHYKFCSYSCSMRYTNDNRTLDINLKISNTLKNRPSSRKGIKNKKWALPHSRLSKIYFDIQICSCCNIPFRNKNRRQTCSPECQRKNSTYRKIVNEYEHDGEILKLESSWEVEIAKWLDTNKIKWIRPKHISWIDSKNKQRKYFPDFNLPDFDLYLDPKNSYQISISEEKLKAVQLKVNLVYGEVEYIKQFVAKLAGL